MNTPTTLTAFESLNYIASYSDLISIFSTDTTAASSHYINSGYAEGRELDTFDEWGYLASNNDLLNAFGSDTTRAVNHYISYGNSEGRSTTSFNAQSYLNNYADLKSAFGNDQTLAAKHYVESGYAEGRTDFSSVINSVSTTSTSTSGSTSTSTSTSTSGSGPTSYHITLTGLGGTSDITGELTGNLSNYDSQNNYTELLNGSDYSSFSNIDSWTWTYRGKTIDATEGGQNSRIAIQNSDFLETNGWSTELGAENFQNINYFDIYNFRIYAEDGIWQPLDVNISSYGFTGDPFEYEVSFFNMWDTALDWSLTSWQVVLSDLEALNYTASYGDLISAFGTDLSSAKSHYKDFGKAEGRALDTFDEWGYLASNNDLLNAFGSDTTRAVNHYISYGNSEGRSTTSFNAQSYLNNYADLKSAFGNDHTLAAKHYVESGFNEGRVF